MHIGAKRALNYHLLKQVPRFTISGSSGKVYFCTASPVVYNKRMKEIKIPARCH